MPSKKNSPMPAGRELDALVCERVFGYLVNRPDSGAEMRAFRIDGPVVRFEIHGMGGELTTQIPHYSTDIAAAWEVVEYFRQRGDWPEMDWDGNRWYARMARTRPSSSGGSTAPEAICLAALNAVTARRPDRK